jgi:hypothetical protein
MIKENIFGSEYVIVPANIISSWSESSRGKIFARGADTEQSEVSDVSSRNSNKLKAKIGYMKCEDW